MNCIEFYLSCKHSEHGVAGEVVTLEKHLARHLLKQSEAVYASPENLQEIATSIVCDLI